MKSLRAMQTATVLAMAATLPTITAKAGMGDKTPAVQQFQPGSHVKEAPFEPAATSSPTGFTPAQIRQAYGFDQLPASIDGTGQTIAIVDAFGDRYATITTNTTIVHHKKVLTYTTNYTDVTQTDYATFCNQFGLSTNGLTVVYPQGQGTASSGWALETALDIQWAHAIAPGANILLVISADNSIVNMNAAVDYAVSNGANIVSMSWGGSDSTNITANDFHFTNAAVSFVACAGDSSEGAWWPSVCPSVLSVGGTQLTNYNGTWSESAWSGTGGGISVSETMPAYQSGGWQQFPTSGMRSLPDVSYQGGPNPGVSVYMTADGGWITVYGTSVGTPQWAALLGLANSARTSGTLTNANAAIYSAAAIYTAPPSITANYFNDVIAGTNGPDADDAALAGYDYVTGLGSPKANNLVPILTTY